MKKKKMISDKTSWFDGYLYDKLIGPQVAKGTAKVKGLFEEDSTILDIGCGIGIFAFALADKCKSVTGVDFSSKMINYANKKKVQKNCQNVNFIHFDAGRVSEVIKADQRFDYVTMTLFLHETDQETRERATQQASKLADRVFISDFASPFPKGWYSKFLVAQERFAGHDHYRCFKNWMAGGGIDGFIEKMGLIIERTIPWPGKNKGVGKVIICHGSTLHKEAN